MAPEKARRALHRILAGIQEAARGRGSGMVSVRKLIAGNWKMNGLSNQIVEAVAVAEDLARNPPKARVAICPPTILVHRIAERLARTIVEVGAQDLHGEAAGAFTGDTSGEMLHDAG
eukprot:gene15149-19153_t